MEEKKKKHLSAIANDVLRRSAEKLDTSVDLLIEEFEREWEPQSHGYSRNLVEFVSSKTIKLLFDDDTSSIDESIADGFFTRFTFDMMLAWEISSSEEEQSHFESVGKEKEDKLVSMEPDDEIPLFYSDVMPLLVDGEASAGEDAFVWLGTLVPLVVNRVNGRFTFETLTASTGGRLYFPGYDVFLKEICKCVNNLKNQSIPKGVELADDEFILHVEGTASTQRVVRHIGGTSWPGRLTLTNYALYFEASGVLSYDDALRLDLSKDISQNVTPAATGPWGAPLFDKAIVYESSELEDGVVLEFPEMASSTRRDHWLALVKEVMLLHRFLKLRVESVVESWEAHARTILGIIRLHAAREMLRISPPEPKSFLMFVLLDELPKGDYVLQELAENLKNFATRHPFTASSTLKNLNVSERYVPSLEAEKIIGDNSELIPSEDVASLDSAIERAREEGKEMDKAKATSVKIKEEGISESAQVLLGLLKLMEKLFPPCRRIITWEQPATTFMVLMTILVVIYKEYVGLALSALLIYVVARMLHARLNMVPQKLDKIIIQSESAPISLETIVSAQQALRSIHELMQLTNIVVLKIWSIMISKAPKHTNTVIVIMGCLAVVLATVPLKFILMGAVVCGFLMGSKMGKYIQNEKGNRRLKEWWATIPIIPVEIVDKH